jgi:hypothetical protein
MPECIICGEKVRSYRALLEHLMAEDSDGHPSNCYFRLPLVQSIKDPTVFGCQSHRQEDGSHMMMTTEQTIEHLRLTRGMALCVGVRELLNRS